MLEELEQKKANKCKWEEKKSRSEKKVLLKQLIEESDDDVKVISNVGNNNFNDDSSEPDVDMETGSINYNFKMFFIFLLELLSILY